MSSGEQFLHQRDPNLHKSDEVAATVDYLSQNGERIPNQPDVKIAAHLGFLADVANDGILTGDQVSIDRQVEAKVIRAKDVPEGYFQLQQRIAREQGHGDITITPELRHQLTEAVQTDQRASLNNWVEYLGGDDGSYPNWFKAYAWESVTKLGSYDKEKQQFSKRSTGTTAPYPEVNREALAYVYDNINKTYVHGEQPDNEKLAKILQGANFGKLYAHAILEVTPDDPEVKKNIEGSWKKFDQTTDPRTGRRLAESLQGHGTGWCTAGESTANMQLRGGDFYVYYTKDEKDNETIPRVAIRMENGKVAEVRGVEANQNLEGIMSDTTMEKLQELPGGEEYIGKAEDMKHLTQIEQRIAKEPDAELSKDEVKFLYEIGHTIQGFGYYRDPRIDDIKQMRETRDHEQLKIVSIEHLRETFTASVQGYSTVMEQLDHEPTSEAQLNQLFEQKMQQWEQNGVLDYVKERIISHNELHTPVISPEAQASGDEIKQLAVAFGKAQPLETYFYDELYSQYTAAELSGKGELSISLIPSKYDEELSRQNVEQQLETLAERQSKNPELNYHVPTVLDALSLWQTLRAAGDKLNEGSAFDKTVIRHFDLEPRRFDAWALVPFSDVNLVGKPSLSRSVGGRGDYARLSVG